MPENSKTMAPMAPIVLKTFEMPTELTQGTIAKTKIVLSVLRVKAKLTNASPTTWSERCQQLDGDG